MTARFDLRHGDSREVLDTLEENSLDSAVCDPPYALDTIVKRFGGENAAPPRAKEGTDGAFARASSGFMGQAWDTGETAFNAAFWAKVYRALKPGGYLVAFGGTRTYHRLVCAIEDAGFMIEDMIPWLYGSGFPKSHKPSIYLERLLCTRFVLEDGSIVWRYTDTGEDQRRAPPFRHPQANAWWGYGSALKPAIEPVCLAQKPLIGSMAENLLAYGTGVLNIDPCRIEVDGDDYAKNAPGDRGYADSRPGEETIFTATPGKAHAGGRWPANLTHDGSAAVLAAFPEATGMKAPVGPETLGDRNAIYNPIGPRADHAPRDAGGSAARFFYGSKASKADREEGCEHLETATKRKNEHPTVKPTDLMRWYCRLVTPRGGVILDPFMGSGSTGKAAMLEGFRFVGIEREAKFFSIAEARVARAALRREVAPPQADLFAAE